MLTRGVLGSVLVLLGGLVVSALPESAPILDGGPLAALRAHTAGRMVGLGVVLLGLGLLAGAWLALCRAVAGAEGAQRAAALALVRRATVLWCLPLLVAPPLFSRDGWSYAAQGMLVHVGLSPYEFGPGVLAGPIEEAVDPRWMGTPAPYGPLPLIFGDLGASLTGNPWVLVVGHRLVALAGLALLAWAVPRMAGWTGVNPALASAVVLVSPLMMANGVGGLHNDLLMVGLMAAALVSAVEHGWFAGAVLGGLAAAVKLPGGLICVLVVLVSLPAGALLVDRLRRLAQVAAVSVGTLVGTGVLWGLGTGWIEALSVPASIDTLLSPPTLLGRALDRAAALLGTGLEPDTFRDLVRAAAMAGLLGFAAWTALRRRTGDPADGVRGAALLVGAALLLSPVVHLWYFLWLVPFVAPLRLPRTGAMAVVAVSVLTGLVAPLDSSLHGAYLVIMVGAMSVAGLMAVLLLSRHGRERIRNIAEADPVTVA
ncbi:polyprenol phosphomannose-dependent alpha 1,6 mannosyltransferase MptB [Myceligenerans salitolerans]|uniref:Polyprenol phosphomannose-dependent alpha 1,6 mannosyltransferase MptB n=1 Tax=Myceligenerans salitolerans TaxID=1230528 RepID=A0ABS3IBU8_9MICO|nr:polyprenol phosphomannose-dependent alpha 1,6 mannosyltransferase MptB [Myceligenerans salitolerans]MBO0610096.1 polyprenol phosphomannose-dependent alpha 1,6 mannosyltransferase MptB [Myceligenerans salitolerans]